MALTINNVWIQHYSILSIEFHYDCNSKKQIRQTGDHGIIHYGSSYYKKLTIKAESNIRYQAGTVLLSLM
uniref:Uncharacterized protein n=1 Tax=Setaria italica TaxID=4555 RepID=K3ZYS5_SETIT